MLVLTRKVGEEILIGDEVRIMVTEFLHREDGLVCKVRLGITAPKHIKIIRPDAVKQEAGDE